MSLASIEFEARILGLSLETKIFLIRKEERKNKVIYRGVLAHCLKMLSEKILLANILSAKFFW